MDLNQDIWYHNIKYLFNQTIIKIYRHEIDWIKQKRKKYYTKLHILEILYKIFFLFLKIYLI
jgi:hypothetical protein